MCTATPNSTLNLPLYIADLKLFGEPQTLSEATVLPCGIGGKPHQPFSLPHLMSLIQEATAATQSCRRRQRIQVPITSTCPFPGLSRLPHGLLWRPQSPVHSHIFSGYFSITASDPEILGPESQLWVLGIGDMVGNSGGT